MAVSPSTEQVAVAYDMLRSYGVSRWTVESALKAAMNVPKPEKKS